MGVLAGVGHGAVPQRRHHGSGRGAAAVRLTVTDWRMEEEEEEEEDGSLPSAFYLGSFSTCSAVTTSTTTPWLK